MNLFSQFLVKKALLGSSVLPQFFFVLFSGKNVNPGFLKVDFKYNLHILCPFLTFPCGCAESRAKRSMARVTAGPWMARTVSHGPPASRPRQFLFYDVTASSGENCLSRLFHGLVVWWFGGGLGVWWFGGGLVAVRLQMQIPRFARETCKC